MSWSRRSETGTLRISTLPVSRCVVDGQTFVTPRILLIHAGVQPITCRNEDLGASDAWTIFIPPGGELRVFDHALTGN